MATADRLCVPRYRGLRRHCSQQHLPLAGRLRDDNEVRINVEQAAARAGATKFINALNDGFNTHVGDRGVRLSAGQRQRLFIARELYKDPRLLILDEATSALDSESELVIKDSVEQLKGLTTIVIIAHRLSTIKNADYIYVLDKGRIVEQGSYEELALTDGGDVQPHGGAAAVVRLVEIHTSHQECQCRSVLVESRRKVSVVIPVHNRPVAVRRAIDSVLAQTCQDSKS